MPRDQAPALSIGRGAIVSYAQCVRDRSRLAPAAEADPSFSICGRQAGYGGADEILFEDGKRCNLSGEQSRYDDASSEGERPTVSDAVRQMINDERAAWMQMDRVKDGLINRLTDDREKLSLGLKAMRLLGRTVAPPMREKPQHGTKAARGTKG